MRFRLYVLWMQLRLRWKFWRAGVPVENLRITVSPPDREQ